MAQSVLGKADEKITYSKDVKSDKSSSDHEKQDGQDDVVGAPPKLQRRLKSRHLQMIAIGMSYLLIRG